MPTTLTISTPDALACKMSGPNRYPPQAEAMFSSQRFAELLQHRREAQPPAKAQPAPQPEPRPESSAKPIAREPGTAEANAKARGKSAARDEDKPADDATLEASTGRAAPKPKTTGKTATQPTDTPRDLPNIEVPTLPPTLATDSVADGSNRADTTPAGPSGDPSFWPGMPAAMTDAAAAGKEALAAGGNGTLDLRIGTGAPGATGTLAAGLTLTGGTAGETGQQGTGRHGAGGQGGDAAVDNAAALLAEAASNAEATATASAAGDRFALSPRASAADVTLPDWAGGIAAHRAEGRAGASIALPTPLAAPDFAKALGAQVSLFARNGLAQAELQLTPAEMGPIRVQIVIDGAHARVDFAADSATTRQVIERGLPELASALREQGLTLSGGGVFQHAPDQRGDAQTPAGRLTRISRGAGLRADETIAAESAEPAARARAIAAQRGGVDLYA
ncbi:MAG: flagellar hook-length control protein FliK [Burkholderiales bacterium]